MGLHGLLQGYLYLSYHQMLVCADDVNLWGGNIDSIKKNTKILIDASKKVVVQVNADRTKYMLLSRHQNAEQNHNIKTGDISFENVAQFKYLGTTLTIQNLIQEETKRRLNSGSACYHSVQNLFSSRMLYKRVKIRIYQTIILLVVLYGFETWSLTFGEEHRLKMFENRVLRRIFGPQRDKIIGGWRKLHNEELHN
jgi:hypothetical protein